MDQKQGRQDGQPSTSTSDTESESEKHEESPTPNPIQMNLNTGVVHHLNSSKDAAIKQMKGIRSKIAALKLDTPKQDESGNEGIEKPSRDARMGHTRERTDLEDSGKTACSPPATIPVRQYELPPPLSPVRLIPASYGEQRSAPPPLPPPRPPRPPPPSQPLLRPTAGPPLRPRQEPTVVSSSQPDARDPKVYVRPLEELRHHGNSQEMSAENSAQISSGFTENSDVSKSIGASSFGHAKDRFLDAKSHTSKPTDYLNEVQIWQDIPISTDLSGEEDHTLKMPPGPLIPGTGASPPQTDDSSENVALKFPPGTDDTLKTFESNRSKVFSSESVPKDKFENYKVNDIAYHIQPFRPAQNRSYSPIGKREHSLTYTAKEEKSEPMEPTEEAGSSASAARRIQYTAGSKGAILRDKCDQDLNVKSYTRTSNDREIRSTAKQIRDHSIATVESQGHSISATTASTDRAQKVSEPVAKVHDKENQAQSSHKFINFQKISRNISSLVGRGKKKEEIASPLPGSSAPPQYSETTPDYAEMSDLFPRHPRPSAPPLRNTIPQSPGPLRGYTPYFPPPYGLQMPPPLPPPPPPPMQDYFAPRYPAASSVSFAMPYHDPYSAGGQSQDSTLDMRDYASERNREPNKQSKSSNPLSRLGNMTSYIRMKPSETKNEAPRRPSSSTDPQTSRPRSVWDTFQEPERPSADAPPGSTRGRPYKDYDTEFLQQLVCCCCWPIGLAAKIISSVNPDAHDPVDSCVHSMSNQLTTCALLLGIAFYIFMFVILFSLLLDSSTRK